MTRNFTSTTDALAIRALDAACVSSRLAKSLGNERPFGSELDYQLLSDGLRELPVK